MSIQGGTSFESTLRKADSSRILALPTREPTDEQIESFGAWVKANFGRGKVQCLCKSKYNRPCCEDLRPVQARAMFEMYTVGGCFGNIGAGHGKTLLDLLAPMVCGGDTWVLLLPSSLRTQCVGIDYEYYSQHWQLPNIVGGQWAVPGRPTLHVLGYAQLSAAKSSGLLHSMPRIDGVIADECQAIGAATTARGKRFKAFLKSRPQARVAMWSGTTMNSSFKDWAHLCAMSLKASSPTPVNYVVINEFAGHLDPVNNPLPVPSGMESLARHGSMAAEYFGKVLATPGVVSTQDALSCNAELRLHQITLPGVGKKILKLLPSVDAGERPDGETLVEALEIEKCKRQLALGFFYRFRYPNGETLEQIEAWLKARKDWRTEMRDVAKRGKLNLDSVKLIEDAAHRWLNGYKFFDADIPPKTKDGPMVTYRPEYYAAWLALRDTVKPVPQTVWVSDELVDITAAWLMRGGPRVAWYEFSAFAAALTSKLEDSIVYCPAGEEGKYKLLALTGAERVLTSKAYHVGVNSLSSFSETLVTSPMASNKEWEQLLARFHRPGQRSDAINVYCFTHTPGYAEAMEKSRVKAQYAKATWAAPQRLTDAVKYFFDTKSFFA